MKYFLPFLLIILTPVFADQCTHALIYHLSPKSETLIAEGSCSLEDSQTFVRPYYVYNDINFLLQYIPHVALEVQTCYEGDCTQTSYGKAQNSKIYSPDILTSGRECMNENSRCKNINPGYGKRNITDWIPIEPSNSVKLHILLNKETIKPSSYSLFFNNCASFVSNILSNIGISFSCSFGFFDLPYMCR
ncbi:hypothetical protein CPAV1605_985 [seawater metagenome]|uniref:DUF4105 domain-containing protein n=1 Tax=seawater metagenome TaxID=1561972 RepID=A0A5E8CMF6_9ZZZZ